MGSEKKAVNFSIGGQEYSLRYSMNAMVSYQDKSGEPFLRGLGLVEKDPTDFVRLHAIFGAGLYGQDVSKDQVGDIMDHLGIEDVFGLVTEAGHIAFPVPEETTAKAGGASGKKKPAAKA